jgi:hypothetical protein
MAKIDITRTELVWPGKYNEDGTLKGVPRVSLPFQVIETIHESLATREVEKGGVQCRLPSAGSYTRRAGARAGWLRTASTKRARRWSRWRYTSWVGNGGWVTTDKTNR